VRAEYIRVVYIMQAGLEPSRSPRKGASRADLDVAAARQNDGGGRDSEVTHLHRDGEDERARAKRQKQAEGLVREGEVQAQQRAQRERGGASGTPQQRRKLRTAHVRCTIHHRGGGENNEMAGEALAGRSLGEAEGLQGPSGFPGEARQ